MRWRLLSMGLSTVLGVKAKGFFIPYRYAQDLRRTCQRRDYSAFTHYFEQTEDRFLTLLEAIDGYGDALRDISGPPPAPRFDQDWFPTLDAAAAYAVVRQNRPSRIVEIGCGHSTRFFVRAMVDEGLRIDVVAIDPAPRADLAGLDIKIYRDSLASVGLAPFEALSAGDVLSIDSSHILVPGSDVDDFLNHILPRLPSGVLVHIHDIFLPDAYPREWAWRGYNEQNAIAGLILGGGWDIIFASHYVATRLRNRLKTSVIDNLPRVSGAHNASLWLKKRS